MAFMTPQQYGRLLWKVFFKGRSLLREVETWKKIQHTKTLVQAGVYNLCLVTLVIFLVALSAKYFSFEFDFTRAFVGVAVGVVTAVVMVGVLELGVLGLTFGVPGSVVLGVVWVWGVAWGVAEGVAVSVATGLAFGVAGGVILGVARGVVFGVAMGVAWGIGWGLFRSVAMGVAMGVAVGVVYFTVWSRYFYLPGLVLPYLKNVAPAKLPFHWDENICAPLPFLSHTLVRISRYDQSAAIAEAVMLIRERPPQRRAAQRALVRIAIDEMCNFRDLRNIAHLPQELAFLPQELQVFPDFYQEGYTALTAFAQDAQAALAEYNSSNRLRMLERLASSLQDFRKQMDFAKKDLGLPFGKIAQHWEQIVRKEVQQIEAQSGRPLPNPFVVGVPVKADSEIFIGRKDIIEHIQNEALREGGAAAILFVGNRRTGKTSTLLNLKRYLISGLKPVFVDCQDPTVTGSISYFCKTLSKLMQRTLGEAGATNCECSSLAELTEWLKGQQEALQQKQQHVLLCFDEYEKFTEKVVSGEFADLPNTLRYWVQHLPRLICLFSGAHSLNEAASFDWSNYLINVRTVPISYLDSESAIRLVTAPISRFELQYETGVEAAQRLVHRLGCQPYLLQATMSELVNYLNRSNRKTATSKDIEIAIEKMMVSATEYFKHLWQRETNAEEKQILLQAAKQSKLATGLEKAIRTLQHREVLRTKNGHIEFYVPVFAEWILKYA